MSVKTGCIASLLLTVITVFPGVLPGEVRAELFGEGQYSLDTYAGYHAASVGGYRGKVGEYETLDSGMEGGFTLHSYGRGTYLDAVGTLRDEDDQRYLLNFGAGRIFESETTYTRFKHYLDHDSLANQDSYTDHDPFSRNAIIREEMKSENTLRIPFIPTLTFHADFRELDKRGHQQATTVSKCTECHVTSRDKRINQRTTDSDLGAEMTVGFLTFQYSNLQRSFAEGGAPPLAYYGFSSPAFPVEGYQYYGRVSDSRTSTNRLRTTAVLPLRSSLSLDYRAGTNRNRDSGAERDFDSIAARLSTAAFKYVSFSFTYHDYNMDTDVPDAMERDFTRSSVSFKTMPWKKSFFTGGYRWEEVERRDSAEESTAREVASLSFVSRLHRTLDLNLRYRNERTRDPFVNEEWKLFRSLMTSEPTRRDEARMAINWSPRGNLSLSSFIVCDQADSSRYDIDEERVEAMLSIWYAPRENVTVTGTYGLIDTRIDASTAYRTVHGVWLSDITADDHVPYDGRSNFYSLLLNYRLLPNLALSSTLSFTDSRADFDSSVYDTNVGAFSDLTIERLDASFGLDYLYKPSISFYATYNLRDYNDRENDDLDGSLHYISLGVQYAF